MQEPIDRRTTVNILSGWTAGNEAIRESLRGVLSNVGSELQARNAEIAMLKEALLKAEADAERYRWLRAQDDDDFCFAVVKNPHFDVYGSPEELDAAIDAARAAKGGE